MSHPEFILEEDEPQTPFLDGTDEDLEAEELKKRSEESPGESSPLNTNNNAMDSNIAEDTMPEPESPLHSLETSV